MRQKIYRMFVVLMFVVLAYTLGGFTGYVVGYNDHYAEIIAKYRTERSRSLAVTKGGKYRALK